jgi:O-antigen ligase
VAYLAISGLGLLLAPDLGLALEDWLRAVSAFMVYVLVVDLLGDERDWHWMVRILVLATIVPVVSGVYQFFTDTGNHGTDNLNRLQGTFTHPAPYAFFLVGLLPLSIVYFMHTRSRLARVALFLLIPAIIFCIYGSQTRGAWIGLGVLVTVFLATKARWAVLLVPLAAGAMFFALPGFQARIDEASSDTGSVFWRAEQWKESLQVANPVELVTVGAGLRAVDVQTGALAHNEYIRLLAETGLPGLIAVLWLYKSLLGIALTGYRQAPTPFRRDLMLAFIMALLARMVSALADNILIYPALEWYFWAFAGVVVIVAGAADKSAVAQGAEETDAEVKTAA